MKWWVGLLLGFCLCARVEAVSVNLNWDYLQGGDQAVGFQLYRQANCAGVFVKLNTVLIPVTTVTFTDASITAGQTYCWQVTAVDSIGMESTPSNVLRFQLQAPQAPTNLRGTIIP